MKTIKKKIAVLVSALAMSSACMVQAANQATVNPYLATSNNPIPHSNSAQQDNVQVAGPTSPSRTLNEFSDITFTETGPFQFGQSTSSVYPDGRRVMWGSGSDRIVKVDQETQAVLASVALPGRNFLNMGIGLEAIHNIDTLDPQAGLAWVLQNMIPYMADLSGAYTLVDKDNQFIVGRSEKVDPTNPATSYRSSVFIYGDETEGEAGSAIVVRDSVQLPEEVKGSLVGMGMTFNGWLMLISGDGHLVAVSRDLRRVKTYNLANMIDGVDTVEVRNSIAIDENGGIYVATTDRMIKVVWNGFRFLDREWRGAWAVEYPNGAGVGTGSTPSLMGFGEEDRFVTITDGEELMGLALFWRDRVPADWEAPAGTTDRRYAGLLKTGMAEATQTEQAVVVQGYGAIVVNNTPAARPAWYPGPDTLLVGWLGHHDFYKPHGMQKFEWDPVAREMKSAWINMDVSSLNGVPMMSVGSNMVYTIGAREGKYSLEGIDWTTGETSRTWVLGGARFNSLYAGMLIDEKGRFQYTGLWGKVRVDID